ncbi:transglutaminase-like cysteine peptidase [Sinorhizobium mexicanum]|uniref:Transglutaminase n=1 Tax=Sinorhizobium mexicanum TaxID=375549 RepID=A0A859QSL1_9HYPH|nr:transglutaminase-like cysteine peptidase [Sinorhizobium mexicanum]QLL60248.1 transglutaminase [Sinorhizobium mexicanum]
MASWTGVKASIAAFCAVFISANTAIPAQAGPSPWMQTGSVTSQPIGHYEFCQKHRGECGARSKTTVAPRVTDRGWAVIRQVNAQVNREITPVTDQQVFGRDEVWSYPTTTGDCEDFALEKRRRLMQRGFSASQLLMTVVRKPDGEGHAVLTVRTAQGDFILDNLENRVRLWTQTPYRYLKRQASYNSGRWVTIDNGGEIVVGSVGN